MLLRPVGHIFLVVRRRRPTEHVYIWRKFKPAMFNVLLCALLHSLSLCCCCVFRLVLYGTRIHEGIMFVFILNVFICGGVTCCCHYSNMMFCSKKKKADHLIFSVDIDFRLVVVFLLVPEKLLGFDERRLFSWEMAFNARAWLEIQSIRTVWMQIYVNHSKIDTLGFFLQEFCHSLQNILPNILHFTETWIVNEIHMFCLFGSILVSHMAHICSNKLCMKSWKLQVNFIKY